MDAKTSPQTLIAERWSLVAQAIEQLGSAYDLDSVVDILRSTARRIASADGIAVILSDDGQCHYVTEDSNAPLWAGQKFPLDSCISGIAMRDRKTIVIPDVLADPRVPHDAYRPTFVRSMLMVPIGRPQPVAALGAYWSEEGIPSDDAVGLLEALGRAASTALENGRLFGALTELNVALEARVQQRTAELEQSQAIARQAQKMETIGHLTGNVAHDFNNLLSPIMGSLDLVLTRRTLDGSVMRSIEIGMTAAERAKLLLQRLLAFSRRQPLVPGPVDLGKLVEGMRDLLASSLGPRVALSLDLASGLPPAQGDQHQLEMALLNLAINARDAMPEGGTLAISATRAVAGEVPADLVPGDYVRLSVRDTGVGMDEKTLIQAIEPFFSTKQEMNGTGLGLSMAHGLAAQLGGSLRLDSTVGKGTLVTMLLPVSKQQPATTGIDDQAGTIAVDGDVALVIDDECMVRNATGEMLNGLGYKVFEAEDARKGLDLIDDGLDPDIVITDHIMPGMTGAELAQLLRDQHPHMPVMIISGYQGIELIAPDVIRLSKPFRQKHLQAGIAAARDQASI